MKLTKQLEKDVTQVYLAYWESYFNGNLRKFASLIDPDYKLIGTSEIEVLNGRQAALQWLKRSVKEIKGKTEFRNRKIKLSPVNELVIVTELADAYVLVRRVWKFYSRIRVSTLLRQTISGWKVVQQHGSMPDPRTGEGETVSFETLNRENLELRDAVKRRTAELENKNRELEIETALEKVRAISLGMKEPADMLDVCKTISLQLQSLGVNDIRNVQTAIFYETRGTYMNYEFYAKHKKTFITETIYTDHKIAKAFAAKMLKGKGEVYSTCIKGEKKVKEWLAYQKKTNVFIDRFLENASSLNYYWHSLGPVALGISTYKPLTRKELGLFNRFLLVFELAYTRYLDIEKAMAQAREAQIEVALERVRARSMAMHKSEELLEAGEILCREMSKLGISCLTSGYVLMEANGKIGWNYTPHPATGKIMPKAVGIPHTETKEMKKVLASWKKKEPVCVIEMNEGQTIAHQTFIAEKSINFPLSAKELISISPSKLVLHNFNFKEGYLLIVGGVKLPDEQMDIMLRFTRVFQQTYTRFLDLQKAEAQAREAQIELGLERVRARAMAMQHSDELAELVDTVFRELTKLDMALTWCMINIIDEISLSNTVWTVNAASGKIPESFHMKFEDYPFHHAMMKGWKQRAAKYVYVLEGQEKKVYDRYLFSETEFRKVPAAAQAASRAMKKYVCSFSFSNFGGLQTVGDTPLSEGSMDILSRFGKVFDLTYTRFNDLKQAEAQAREAEIQLALERVRARTMAMQKSDELPQAANLLFQQIQALGMPAWSAGYCIWDDDKRAITLSMSSEGVLQPSLRMPLTEDPSLIHFLEAHERGETFFVEELGGEELKQHYVYLRTLPGVKETLDDIEKAGFPVPTFQIFHLAYFSKGFLLFITYEPVPEAWDIFRRFAAVFEQTYTRFLDLQKAEAQAREAQIEAAMERVRSRTMAMHKSNELTEVSALLYKELQGLGVTQFLNCGYVEIDELNHIQNAWMTNADGFGFNVVQLPLTGDSVFDERYEAWKRKDKLIHQVAGGDVLKNHIELGTQHYRKTEIDELVRTRFPDPTIFYCGNFNYGYLNIITGTPLTKEQESLLIRFTKVFEMTYGRFLDLQKAEVQAREAQIELSLERVRARTMAMHKSEELVDTSVILFQELRVLGVKAIRTGVAIIDDEKELMELWSSQLIEQKQNKVLGIVPMQSHPFFQGLLKAWRKKDHDFTFEFNGEKVKEFYETMSALISYPAQASYNPREIFSPFFFPEGSLTVVSHDPLTSEERNIMQRFARVFGLLYRRFLDLQKAEAQAKEAQVEVAMERIRARAMAMHTSGELMEVANVLREQMGLLNQPDLETSAVLIFHEDQESWDSWYAFRPTRDEGGSIRNGTAAFSKDDCALTREIVQHYRSGLSDYTIGISGAKREEWLTVLMKAAPEVAENAINDETVHYDTTYFHFSDFQGGSLLTVSYRPPSEEIMSLQRRAASVFDLAFRRFLDLKKAEAQAREAQIEAALERVRSRSMGMQKSEELKDVIKIVYQQLIHLKINLDHAGFVVDFKPKEDWTFWIADEQDIPAKISHPYFESVWANQFNDAKERGAEFFATYLNFEAKNQFYNELLAYVPGLPEASKEFYLSCPGLAASTVLLDNVSLYIENFSGIPYSEEENNTLMRFGKVFQQTYTRFLDLQKAEAQAREAEIELALERVRARTMAMQKSDELPDTSYLVFQQFEGLGVTAEQFSIGIINEAEGVGEMYATIHGDKLLQKRRISIHEPIAFKKVYTAWKSGKKNLILEITGEELEAYNIYRNQIIGRKVFTEKAEAGDRWVILCAFFSRGVLSFASSEQPSDETFQLLERFAKVFDGTYTRFLDLQKAEAQAREAKIEAALERTRTQSMLMQHSEQLDDTLRVFHEQVLLLGIKSAFSFLWLPDEKNDRHIFWAAWAESHSKSPSGNNDSTLFKSKAINYPLDRNEPATAQCLVDWKSDQPVHAYHVPPAEVDSYFSAWKELLDGVEMLKPEYFRGGLYYVEAFMKYGCFGVMIENEMREEEKKLLHRFAIEFERAYTRFLDLQKAEAQAREALIEAALERVRSKAMAMHSSDDLAVTVDTFFSELKSLHVMPRRCGVTLIDQESRIADLTLTTATQGGESKKVMATLKLSGHPVLDAVFDHWKLQQEFHPQLQGDEIREYYKVMNSQVALPDFTGDQKQYGHYFFFKEGGVFAWTDMELAEDEMRIFRRFTSVLSLTYKRYKDLQQAEALAQQAERDLILLKEEKKRTEDALAELQVTQKQLIQSEKMASLGELTAGIAHEIQNPLNFVNNFSEVSNELLDEMLEEAAKGNFEEVKEILNDVKQNLEKINHHGKRADGIVKGMLQHSRSSSGQKEPVDINVLADEYLRLAYHGLRAKDKSFNATMKTAYEEDLPKVNVIPQDIGRVVLNLITNAFYAASLPSKGGFSDSETMKNPTVWVATKKSGNKVIITVKDNGPGIPKEILDKIFQPFFTTKPTGQGTGLGLSLSYDIVKAHGGELKVETEEGKGTEFIVQLPLKTNS